MSEQSSSAKHRSDGDGDGDTAASAAAVDAAAVAAALAQEVEAAHPDGRAAAAAERGLAIAQIVTDLRADPELIAAATVYPLLEGGFVSRRQLAQRLPEAIVRLARQLTRLGHFSFPDNWDPERGLDARQADTLRKMLLAVVEDVRLVLVLLADQCHRLRSVKNAGEQERRRTALEAREIYAPLANKLGVWQLKWEMEDLTFRYLEPHTYKKVARLLQERRTDRETYIGKVTELLSRELEQMGIAAEVQGRPKHIYSIWRKMRRKELDFEQIFDVRAVRVLVGTVADCYAVLGLVHGRWPYIPGEFDDYIATPKDNDYRSLHTAVVGPGNKPLEVQIRTHEMHEHAERGVAAHWRYKEGGAGSDSSYDDKIRWVRQLLEPSDEAESESDFIDRFKADLFEDRVYTLTPNGDILDLPAGATPLDFAYHVHTDLGHRCRGAKVNGRIVPLTYRLASGDQVEVITAKNGTPSRDWLIPQLGYLGSTRARTKVRAWFRHQDQQHNLEHGQAIVDRELSRLGVSSLPLAELARDLGLHSSTDLYIAAGTGDLTVADIAAAVQKHFAPAPPQPEPLTSRRKRPQGSLASGVEVDGVGDLMTSFAQCCKPLPPDAIAGYITVGRGVTIHRRDCANFLNLADRYRERVLEVAWSGGVQSTYPVDLRIEAYDRRGLIKDISSLLASEKVNILGVSSNTDKSTLTARISLTVEITGLDELSRLMHRIANLPNVTGVSRLGG